MTLQFSGQAAVYGHFQAALEAIAAETRGHCDDRCTEATPCLPCRVGHIAACALPGDDWNQPAPAVEWLP